MKWGLIICAHNEPRLASVLQRIDFRATPLVVVVDDGSTDDSMNVTRTYPVTVLRHERRYGVGAAIRTGLTHLKQQGVEVAVLLAGNNKDSPEEIHLLLEAIRKGADYVQGSRFLVPENAQGTPLIRRLLTWGVGVLWSIRFARRLTDATNGFRAYKLTLLDDQRIEIDQNWLDRYELEFYLHYKVLSLGYQYAEVPVTKKYPQDGMSTSKIRLSRDLWSLLRPLVLLSLRLRK